MHKNSDSSLSDPAELKGNLCLSDLCLEGSAERILSIELPNCTQETNIWSLALFLKTSRPWILKI